MLQALIRWMPTGIELDDEDFDRRHRVVRNFLWLHLPVIAIVGVVNGLDAAHVLADTGIVTAMATVSSAARSRRVRMLAASLGSLLAAAALIHVSGGATEAHFQLFVVLVFVSLYQDWRALGGTVVFTVVHHAGVSIVDPDGAFNHAAAQERPLLWATIHAAFVVVQVIGILCFWRVAEDAQRSATEATAAVARAAQERAEVEKRSAEERLAADAARREIERSMVDEATQRAERAEVFARDLRGEVLIAQEAAVSLESEVTAMAEQIDQLGVSAARMADEASQARQAATDGVRWIADGTDIMEQLVAASTEVDEIIEAIATIAGQTNLLALNASIE
ncbi:MAG: methyl-accepting chemotaxis protein, partial [Actinomycetota bacterium]